MRPKIVRRRRLSGSGVGLSGRGVPAQGVSIAARASAAWRSASRLRASWRARPAGVPPARCLWRASCLLARCFLARASWRAASWRAAPGVLLPGERPLAAASAVLLDGGLLASSSAASWRADLLASRLCRAASWRCLASCLLALPPGDCLLTVPPPERAASGMPPPGVPPPPGALISLARCPVRPLLSDRPSLLERFRRCRFLAIGLCVPLPACCAASWRSASPLERPPAAPPPAVSASRLVRPAACLLPRRFLGAAGETFSVGTLLASALAARPRAAAPRRLHARVLPGLEFLVLHRRRTGGRGAGGHRLQAAGAGGGSVGSSDRGWRLRESRAAGVCGGSGGGGSSRPAVLAGAAVPPRVRALPWPASARAARGSAAFGRRCRLAGAGARGGQRAFGTLRLGGGLSRDHVEAGFGGGRLGGDTSTMLMSAPAGVARPAAGLGEAEAGRIEPDRQHRRVDQHGDRQGPAGC